MGLAPIESGLGEGADGEGMDVGSGTGVGAATFTVWTDNFETGEIKPVFFQPAIKTTPIITSTKTSNKMVFFAAIQPEFEI